MSLSFQLEDGHTLFDYSVGLNDLVQLMVRAADVKPIEDEAKKVNGYASSDNESSKSDKENQRVCFCIVLLIFSACI